MVMHLKHHYRKPRGQGGLPATALDCFGLRRQRMRANARRPFRESGRDATPRERHVGRAYLRHCAGTLSADWARRDGCTDRAACSPSSSPSPVLPRRSIAPRSPDCSRCRSPTRQNRPCARPPLTSRCSAPSSACTPRRSSSTASVDGRCTSAISSPARPSRRSPTTACCSIAMARSKRSAATLRPRPTGPRHPVTARVSRWLKCRRTSPRS